MHHIRKLKDVAEGKTLWQQMMAARRRKTLVLCTQCHHLLHKGELPEREYRQHQIRGEPCAMTSRTHGSERGYGRPANGRPAPTLLYWRLCFPSSSPDFLSSSQCSRRAMRTKRICLAAALTTLFACPGMMTVHRGTRGGETVPISLRPRRRWLCRNLGSHPPPSIP